MQADGPRKPAAVDLRDEFDMLREV